jgi:hypothetical protein
MGRTALAFAIGVFVGVAAAFAIMGRLGPQRAVGQWERLGFSRDEALRLVTAERAGIAMVPMTAGKAQGVGGSGAAGDARAAGAPAAGEAWAAGGTEGAEAAPAGQPQVEAVLDARARVVPFQDPAALCADLAPSRFESVGKQMEAMEAAGGPWKELVDRTRVGVAEVEWPQAVPYAWQRLCRDAQAASANSGR